jgi:hypothetical protein
MKKIELPQNSYSKTFSSNLMYFSIYFSLKYVYGKFESIIEFDGGKYIFLS